MHFLECKSSYFVGISHKFVYWWCRGQRTIIGSGSGLVLTSWWRHQMETFSVLLAFVRGIHRSPVNSPHKGQWRRSLMFLWSVPEQRMSKQSRRWWFETSSRPLWRHCNEQARSNDHQDFWCHMALLGHNELKWIFGPFFSPFYSLSVKYFDRM